MTAVHEAIPATFLSLPLAISAPQFDTVGMASQTSLTNQFLIAMPAMDNPYFDHTVSYICDHNEEGAMGFVINRPIGITIQELFEQVEIETHPDNSKNHNQVYFGGPVERERGFVLHSGAPDWNASMPVTKNLSVTTSLDILEAIGRDEGPDNFLLVLGYAGWGPGQLEEEILDNAWLSTPASREIIFSDTPSASWQQAAQLIGVDVQQLTSPAGHA